MQSRNFGFRRSYSAVSGHGITVHFLLHEDRCDGKLTFYSRNTIWRSGREMTDTDRPLEFVGSSKDDLSGFPLEVKRGVGFALRAARKGGKHPDAKPPPVSEVQAFLRSYRISMATR